MSKLSSSRWIRAAVSAMMFGTILSTQCTARFRDSVVDGITSYILSPQIPAAIAACVDESGETTSLFCPSSSSQ